MIARLWRGAVHEARADEYLEYLEETGLGEYRATPGNRGVYVLRRIEHGRAEFLLVSLWESMAAVRSFAGPDIEKAVYYPKDMEFLLDLEPNVRHYEVLAAPDPGGR